MPEFSPSVAQESHRSIRVARPFERTSRMKAKDLMSGALAIVRASSDVRTALDILRTLDIRYVPVVDDDGSLVGVLSDQDLRALRIPYFIGNEYVGDLRTALQARVWRLLNGTVPFVGTDTDALEVIDTMVRHRIGAVPVTDAEGVLVGIVSYVDVLRALSAAIESTE